MTNRTLLILGARSDIGVAVAHRFAEKGWQLLLGARRADELEPVRRDLTLRYKVDVSLHEFDALDTSSFEPFINQLPILPDAAVCTVGLLGSQEADENNPEISIRVIRSNFEGPAIIFGMLASEFEKRGSGTLIGISSVAGERGRASNYIYGSGKAGFTAFLSGLRNRMAKSGVHVVTVLPGFVATSMTEGMDLPAKLTAQPEAVAAAIEKATQSRRNVIYVKPVWRLIMFIIRSLPEALFKRMKI